MNTVEFAVKQMSKSDRIAEVMELATRMQDCAVEHASLVREFNHPESDIEWTSVEAVAQEWVKAQRDLREFLAVAL